MSLEAFTHSALSRTQRARRVCLLVHVVSKSLPRAVSLAVSWQHRAADVSLCERVFHRKSPGTCVPERSERPSGKRRSGTPFTALTSPRTGC